MSRNESPVTVASVKKDGPCNFSRCSAQRTLTFGESRWCTICACGYSVPQIRALCTFTFLLIWNVASSQKMSLSTESFSSIFNCISSQKSRLFTLSADVRACTNRILYGLKYSRLCNTFHSVIFSMSNSLLALATDLRGFRRNASRTLSVLSSDTRGRQGLLPLHKHPVSTNCRYHPSYVIPAWCLFSKPSTKLTLHCNHRSGHLKTWHTECLFLLRRHLGNWPRGPAVSVRSKLLVANEQLGQLPLLTVYVVPV